MKPQLSIGTVQFGTIYGITNSKGKVNKLEVSKIINFCSENNIFNLDTAQAYGSAEKVLGEFLREDSYFKITSKLSHNKQKNSIKENCESLEAAFSKKS